MEYSAIFILVYFCWQLNVFLHKLTENLNTRMTHGNHGLVFTLFLIVRKKMSPKPFYWASGYGELAGVKLVIIISTTRIEGGKNNVKISV